MPFKVITKDSGVSGTFSKWSDASKYAKRKGLKYEWFFNLPAVDKLIQDIKKLFSK